MASSVEGQLISCHTLDQWKEQLEIGLQSKKLSVSEEYNVEAMPTFVFLKEGKEVDRIVGARKEDLAAKIETLGALTAAA